jgi:hypothetical protein
MLTKGFTHPRLPKQYDRLLADISGLLEQARRTAARSVNAVLTSVYWQIGQRIVEHEQGGKPRAGYGGQLLMRLSEDLTAMHGRGFSGRNLRQMRAFYLGWEIWQTPSAKFEARVICSTLSSKLRLIQSLCTRRSRTAQIPGALPPTPRHFPLWTNSMAEGGRGLLFLPGSIFALPASGGHRQPTPLSGPRHAPLSRDLGGAAISGASPGSLAMLLAESDKCRGFGGRAPNGHRSRQKPGEPGLIPPKFQTPSGKSKKAQTVSARLTNGLTPVTFPPRVTN